MSHTPGPWTYMYDADGDHAIFAGHKMVAITTGAEVVGSREEDEANARLITASLELLKVCEFLIRECTAEPYSPWSEARQMARIAIAKAKGKSL